MDKIAIGVAAYGPQMRDWWVSLVSLTAELPRYDIQLCGILTAGSMATDHNRNSITKSFLEKSDADWLMWIDTDNPLEPWHVRRLLDTKKQLVSGLYYLKQEPHTPVAYTRVEHNYYAPISGWNKGEIIPVDMAGMGACLSHRSVYEDIIKHSTLVQRWDGSVVSVPNAMIEGHIPNEFVNGKSVIKNGVMKTSVCKPTREVDAWPFFILQYLRTEDVHFYELAQAAGHQCWCDTSVEVDHIGVKNYNGSDYRMMLKDRKEKAKHESA